MTLSKARLSHMPRLQALNAHDDARCTQLIQAGRFAIVQLLANAGTDSVAQSNPLILQLQSLAAVADIQQMLSASHVSFGRCLWKV